MKVCDFYREPKAVLLNSAPVILSELGARKCYDSYNKLNIDFVKNNIDLCLFDYDYRRLNTKIYAQGEAYIALGELKGGIDPAGADEHWKTARTALGRIHSAFENYNPATFFIGAAIEKKMADEIWALLQKGTIDNAANLTDDTQIASITSWLCSL